MITIEQIDYIMTETGSSYEVVRKALLENDGDVDKAIKYIYNMGKYEEADYEIIDEDQEKTEEVSSDEKASSWGNVNNQIDNFANEVVDAVKEIWKKGNASRLVVENEDSVILSLSLAISAIGVVIAPLAAILGLSAAVLSKYKFKIVMDNGEIIDLKEYIKNMNKKKED